MSWIVVSEMKIVLIGPTHPYRGGIAHYTTMLHRELSNQGHDVSLVSFKRLYPGWLYPGESDKDPSQETVEADNVHYAIDSLNPVSWLATAAWISGRSPDVVVLSWWTTFLSPAWLVLAALFRLSLRVPLIYLCHNVLSHEAKWWDRGVSRLVLSTGTGHIVQSDAERARLLDLLPRAHPVVVPHPIYDMCSSKLPTKELARRRLRLPLDVPVLLFFGIVREYKGLMDVLEALPEIRRRTGRVCLVVAGEFWEPRAHYDSRVRELGIEDSVVIHDHYIPNEEVPMYFGAADLVVAPHRRATGSGVVQMAIGFGVPLLTTLDQLFEGIDLPAELMLVSACDHQAMAIAISRFLAQPQMTDRADCMSALRKNFSWERLASAIVGLGNP